MPPETLAIDVVLLPDIPMTNTVIALNKKLREHNEPKIVLEGNGCLPHVSIAMAHIGVWSADEVKTVIREVAQQFDPFDITAAEIRTTQSGCSALALRLTPELHALHETLARRLEKYIVPEITEKSFYIETADKASVLCVSNFFSESSYAHFKPHITIGFGKMETPIPAETFTASKIALCHLSNHCTCRKFLLTEKLRRS